MDSVDWFLVSIFFSTSAMANLDVNRTSSKVTAFKVNTVEMSEDLSNEHHIEDDRINRRWVMKINHRHYENMPMQYTEIFKVVRNENFQ